MGSISNGFYTAPALLQGGVGDDIIPMAFMSNYYTIKAEGRDPSTVSTNGIDSQMWCCSSSIRKVAVQRVAIGNATLQPNKVREKHLKYVLNCKRTFSLLTLGLFLD